MKSQTPKTTLSSEITGKRRRTLLNKFLTKTFHMLDQCPDNIACWSLGGDSFTIKDIEAFENEVLPLYFNSTKFPSFLRQLNFYGFDRASSDPDLQARTKAVRFSHPYFRRGNPELLNKIVRTTQKHSEAPPNGQVETLKQQIADMKKKLTSLETQMGERVEEAVQILEKDYLARVQKLEQSYETLLSAMISQYKSSFNTSPYMSPALQNAANVVELAEYIRSGNKNV